MMTVFEEINWRWGRHITVRCRISGLPWVTASVRRPRGGAARPPLNPPLRRTYYISGSAESEYYSIADNERCILNRDGEKALTHYS